MDLNALSLAELKKLSRDVEKAIASYEDRSKAAAMAELEAKAKELGFSLAELMGGAVKPRKARAAATTKYRNPKDASQTWSGRGRKPQWFADALKAGAQPSDLAV